MNAVDAVDTTYERIKDCGEKVYKDKAPINNKPDKHVVVNTLAEGFNQMVNRIPLNINIYFKKNDTGIPEKRAMYALREVIFEKIESGAHPGYLFDIEKSFSELDTTHNKEYDILTTRFKLVITA